jgi:hypothetical protein
MRGGAGRKIQGCLIAEVVAQGGAAAPIGFARVPVEVGLGLGHSVALCYRSSTLYQIR